ncbi:hypothetical protein [Elizabethkingia anophelis]|nr:hypothetical protein [Elizabethkingia anophelis]
MLCVIEEIDGQGVVVDIAESQENEWIDLFQFTPIHLTEEWLVKLGFEKSDSLSNCTKTTNGYKFDFAGGEVLYLDSVRLKHIKYVHQLQNLYFALTGEELTIKS